MLTSPAIPPHVAPRAVRLVSGCAAPLGIPPALGHLICGGPAPHGSRRKLLPRLPLWPGLAHGCPFGRGSLEKLGPHTQASFSPESEVLAAQGGGRARANTSHSSHSRKRPCPCVWGQLSSSSFPFGGCWVPCFAVKANALALPGCSLTSFVLGYCCGLKCFP